MKSKSMFQSDKGPEGDLVEVCEGTPLEVEWSALGDYEKSTLHVERVDGGLDVFVVGSVMYKGEFFNISVEIKGTEAEVKELQDILARRDY
jgi:hypothetical protein